MLKNYTLRDLIHITMFAAIATVSKVPLRMASNFFANTFGLPGGIINGMYYMFWIIAAYALVGKRGTATLFCIVQAMLSLYLSSFPVFKIVTFFPPGLAVDALYLVIRHRGCCKKCMVLGGAVANTAGAVTMALLFLKVPLAGLAVTAVISAFSGGMGGYLAYIVVKQLALALPGVYANFE